MYDTILGFLINPQSTMYHIKIKGSTVQQVANEQTAWANYRATCRQFENKPFSVELYTDDTLLHKKEMGRMLLDDVDNYNANDVLILTMQRLNISIAELKKLLADTELSLSNSRIDGWIRDRTDRKYVQMHHDELMIAIDVMLSNATKTQKNPANILALRQKLGLTQIELAVALGMTANHHQVSRWENGLAEMPQTKWEKMQKLLK